MLTVIDMDVVKLCDNINCKHKCFRYRTWLKEENLRIYNIPYEIYSTLQNDDCCGDKRRKQRCVNTY